MTTLINEDELQEKVVSLVSDIANQRLDELAKSYQVTWTMDEFRKKCCFGKNHSWVAKNVLYPNANKIDIHNGGWCKFPVGGRSSWGFVAKEASKWMEEHVRDFDWY